MKKTFTLLMVLALVLHAITSIAFANDYKQLEKKNTRYLLCKNDKQAGSSIVEFYVTYYSPELWKLHKENTNIASTINTSDFLTTLREEETIAFKIRIKNNASPIELNPINSMITLRVDNKKYKSVEHDISLSYSFQGENEGYIYFSRFDSKTGKDVLKNAKRIWLELRPQISPTMEGKLPSLRWDL